MGAGDPDVVSGLEDEGSAQLLVFLVVEVERRHVENGVGIGGAGVDLDLHGASEQVIDRSAAGSAAYVTARPTATTPHGCEFSADVCELRAAFQIVDLTELTHVRRFVRTCGGRPP